MAEAPPLTRADAVTPEGYEELLRKLAPLFGNASVGDFRTPLPIDEKETPYTPILVGVEVMRQVIQHHIEEVDSLNRELTRLNAELERKVDEKTLEILQSEERLRRFVISRPLVRLMMRRLIDVASIPPAALRAFGDELARNAHAKDVEGYAHAFSAMGLGELHLERQDGGQFTFRARDLIERREGTRMTTCFLTSGYVSGAVAAVTGRATLAGETSCQSRGDPECRFTARVR